MDPERWRLVLIGEPGVGKTQLHRVLTRSAAFADDHRPTIGADIRRRLLSVPGAPNGIRLQAWDLDGESRYRTLVDLCYQHHVPLMVVLVYDVTVEASAAVLFGGTYDRRVKATPPRTHVVVVGTKADLLPDGGAALTTPLAGCLPPDAVARSTPAVRTAAELCADHHVPHYVVSAKTGAGADQMLAGALDASRRLHGQPVRGAPGGTRLPTAPPAMTERAREATR